MTGNGEPDNDDRVGHEMHSLLVRLFPICRSLTGEGVRETLRILQEHIPLKTYEVPTGTKVFDWEIPKEWNVREACIEDERGNKVVDFEKNNLHLVGYSTPIDRWMSLSELQPHLHSLEDQPDAIPYVTSYYQEWWGFCLTHRDRLTLKEGKYRAFIDSTLAPGHLTYADCILPGESEQEVFISTYVCHPSMANNELSGPVVATWLVKYLMRRKRRYTYRIVFIPETIGSITYLSRHLDVLKKRVRAGFNLSCIGDEGPYTYVASRYGNTLADKVAAHMGARRPSMIRYSFLDRASDERQYCSPGVDLPLVSLCRSKYGTYPEYHTSLDNLEFVTPEGLQGGFEWAKDCIDAVEHNRTYRVTCHGEPQLGKRGLYPNVSKKHSADSVKAMMDLLAYADGRNDLIDLANLVQRLAWDLWPIAEKLHAEGLLEVLDGD